MASWFFSCMSQSSWTLLAQWWMVRITGLVSRAPGGPQLTTGLSTVWMSSTGGLEKTDNAGVKWFDGRGDFWFIMNCSYLSSTAGHCIDFTSCHCYFVIMFKHGKTQSAWWRRKVTVRCNQAWVNQRKSSRYSIRGWLLGSSRFQLSLSWSHRHKIHDYWSQAIPLFTGNSSTMVPRITNVIISATLFAWEHATMQTILSHWNSLKYN